MLLPAPFTIIIVLDNCHTQTHHILMSAINNFTHLVPNHLAFLQRVSILIMSLRVGRLFCEIVSYWVPHVFGSRHSLDE